MNAEFLNIFLLPPKITEVNGLFLKTGKVSYSEHKKYRMFLKSETQKYELLESQSVNFKYFVKNDGAGAYFPISHLLTKQFQSAQIYQSGAARGNPLSHFFIAFIKIRTYCIDTYIFPAGTLKSWVLRKCSSL